MAWNNPATFTAGSVLTASTMNAQVRDNFKAIGDSWASYTPTWTGTTNPALGNGTIASAYMQAGKFVNFRIRIVMGSTTTYGTGGWLLTLPVASAVGFNNVLDCSVLLHDTSAGARYMRSAYLNSATQLALADDGGILVSGTAPFTWATGDSLSIAGSYEAA